MSDHSKNLVDETAENYDMLLSKNFGTSKDAVLKAATQLTIYNDTIARENLKLECLKTIAENSNKGDLNV